MNEIKEAYEKVMGHRTSTSQIYYILHHHGWSKKMPRSQPPQKRKRRGDRNLKKIKATIENEFSNLNCDKYDCVHLMFQDKAGFGRINKPKYCWYEKGTRPFVPCHHIREYRYVYGAVEPLTDENCFVVMPYYNTDYMNLFLEDLSNTFPRDKNHIGI